jgi:hypothetical protein
MNPSRPEVVGVDQLPGCPSGVDVDAVHRHLHSAGAERLVLELAGLRAVQGVGAERPEPIEVEQCGPLADLLVGREGDPEHRPRQLRVRGQVRHCGHDLRHAGLVVGAEQRVTARGDDVVAHLAGEHGHHLRVEHGVVAPQLQGLAGVAAVHQRLDACAGRIRAGVHVRDQADHGRLTIR